MSFTIVTAFFDIGRENWTISPRSINDYFINFEGYFHQPYKQILFLDDKYIDKLNELRAKYKNDTHLTVIPINEVWLKNNIWCWNLLERETQIMNSEYFKNLIKHRNTVPETVFPKYTLINHAKIDFICYSIKNNLINDELIAWSDFGCCKIPENLFRVFDFNKIDKNKINICLYNDLDIKDTDIIYTILNAPVKVTGGFYIGNKSLFNDYQQLYHKILLYFQHNDLADDDQHIMLRCYYEYPSLFKLHNMHGIWHLFYKFFEKIT